MKNGIGGNGGIEYYTPAHVIERVRAALGGHIELDVASSPIANLTVQADRYFTKHRSALDSDADWTCETLFVNPPYRTALIRPFGERLVDEIAAGRVKSAIWLAAATTDTAISQLMLSKASRVCFWRGRIAFWNADKEEWARSNGYGSMFLALGDVDIGLFDRCFQPMGVLL